MKKRRKETPEEHAKTCFRCRLHALWAELKDCNEQKFMLIAMAEACGSILSQMDEVDYLMFQVAVQKFMDEDENHHMQTKH